MPPSLTWHGPDESADFVALAPGDMGELGDTGPTAIAEGLANAGLRVGRFPFPPSTYPRSVPQALVDGAARDALLASALREVVAYRRPEQRLVLAGLSRGARVSCSLVGDLGAAGLLGFAYPFHPRQDPDVGDRVEALARLPAPALICQGTRDTHGNRQQIRGYRLPPHIRFHWLEDANHALHPRPRSGFTQAQQLADAVLVAAAFIRSLPTR